MDEIRRLFEYNRWANVEMLDALESLDPEELGRDLGSSFASVLGTVIHAFGAEWVWLERWKGASPTAFPDPATVGSVADIRARWDALWGDQRQFLANLDDAAATRVVAYRTLKGDADAQPLGELVRHVVNHATYHRGQLATMLRQLGKKPPSTDYVRYVREVA